MTMTRMMIIPALAAMLLAGCDMETRNSRTRPKIIEPTVAPATQPARPGWSTELARVNGKPISMEKLNDALVRDYGLPIAQQFIADEVVRQELERQSLPADVTDRQIEEESIRALSHLLSMPKKPSPKQLDMMLRPLLAQNRLSRRQWDATMARNVRLSRLAAKKVVVTENDLQEEFFRRYDGKIMVRHIQVPTLSEAQQICRQLKNGTDFVELVRKHSTNPDHKNGGMLPPIGVRTAPKIIPPALLQAARALDKPGDISSPIQVGTNFHILKLEKIVKPAKVKFEDVKLELESVVRDRKTIELQQLILRDLIQNATIEYVNPVIRAKMADAKKARQLRE